MTKLTVRDFKTRDTFIVDPTMTRVLVKTSDGEKVKIHPTVIRQFVKVGQPFDGNGAVGPRKMERIK